jgi:hypothetical protein
MNPAAAEEYIASLDVTILKRDPTSDEFARWSVAGRDTAPGYGIHAHRIEIAR